MSVEEQEIYKNRVRMEDGWGWGDQTTKQNFLLRNHMLEINSIYILNRATNM